MPNWNDSRSIINCIDELIDVVETDPPKQEFEHVIGAPAPDEDHELKALQHQIAFYKREIADLKNKRNSLRARTDQRSPAGLLLHLLLIPRLLLLPPLLFLSHEPDVSLHLFPSWVFVRVCACVVCCALVREMLDPLLLQPVRSRQLAQPYLWPYP